MKTPGPVHERAAYGNLSSYVIGFGISLVLSLAPFLLVESHIHSGHAAFSHLFLIAIIILCAGAQLLVQLAFFIHVWHTKGGAANTLAFLLGLLFTTILVGGSLWIMYNLKYRMTAQTPQQMEQYMNGQDAM